ncbi:hypothetical protein PB2503_04072 [Parvularcula bermudensis HTCC2503]|uniref:Uncharacterized protein n=2 Tax=Parvularcula TaxID=208215 RepID=E0TEK6_PARBH|nr:hypothetical protein PB2503_04072 [Parvularcula bermudensis HTCC2503]
MAELAGTEGTAVVVINTCAVTNEAVRQSRQAIRRARKDHPEAKLIVSGCAVETDRDRLAAMPEIDHLIPNADKLKPESYAGATAPLSRSPQPVRAPLAIQNGCDHSCTFCIIPQGRGRAQSRPIAEAVAEAHALVAAGAREIVLTGVDLTSYGDDLEGGVTLADPIEVLLTSLPAAITLRLSSLDGAEVDDRLFRLLTEEDRVAPYAHLSLQAGHDLTLKRMKRRHLTADAIDLTDRLRTARPDFAFGADLIAGFPTETEEMFAASLDHAARCGLAFLHVFPFSPRVGTPAARMPQIDRAVVKDRAKRLRALGDDLLAAHLDRLIGQRVAVLIEQTSGTHLIGRLPNFTEIEVEAEGQAGERIMAHVTGHTGRRLMGRKDADHG